MYLVPFFTLGYSCRLVSQNMALILLKEDSLDVSSFSKLIFDIIVLNLFFYLVWLISSVY